MWHCPHCGAPQAETARCWVCRRSSTTCSTCSHFRRAVSADLGYCALDRRRLPLTGRELRGCWEARAGAAPAEASPATPIEGFAALTDEDDLTTPVHRLRPPTPRAFMPLDLVDWIEVPQTLPVEPPPPPRHARQPDTPAPQVIGDADEDWEARTSLFGDPPG
jgi:hypothetical protein